MALLNKLTDLIKEVFWLKKPAAKKRPRSTPARRIPKKKKVIKPKPAPKPKIKPAPKVKSPKIPAVPKKKTPVLDPSLVQVGEITHYFDRIKVCVIKITQGSILIGDRLTIKGPKTFFVQKVWSMQIESQDVKVAKKGQMIGIKVDKLVAVGDIVFK